MSGADQTARPSTASGHKVEHDWSIAQFPCDWDPVSIKSQKYETLVPGGQGLGDTWMRVDYDSARHLKSICLISCQSTFVLKNLFLWIKSGRCLDGCVKWERECWLKEEIDGRWNSNRVLIFWIKLAYSCSARRAESIAHHFKWDNLIFNREINDCNITRYRTQTLGYTGFVSQVAGPAPLRKTPWDDYLDCPRTCAAKEVKNTKGFSPIFI